MILHSLLTVFAWCVSPASASEQQRQGCPTPTDDLQFLRESGESANEFITNAALPREARGWLEQHPDAFARWMCVDEVMWRRDRGDLGHAWIQEADATTRAVNQRSLWFVYQALMRAAAVSPSLADGQLDSVVQGLWLRQYRGYSDADVGILRSSDVWQRMGRSLDLWHTSGRRHGYAKAVAVDASARLRTAYLDHWDDLDARVREAVDWWTFVGEKAASRDDRLSAALNVLDTTAYASDTLRDAFILKPPKGSADAGSLARWRKDVDDIRIRRWAVVDMGLSGAEAALADIQFQVGTETDWQATAALATWLSGGLGEWYEDRYQIVTGGYALSDLGDPGRLLALADDLDQRAWRSMSRRADVPDIQRAVLVDSLTALRIWRSGVAAYAMPDTVRAADVLTPIARVSEDFGPQTRFAVCRFVGDDNSPLEAVFLDQGATRKRIVRSVKCPEAGNSD